MFIISIQHEIWVSLINFFFYIFTSSLQLISDDLCSNSISLTIYFQLLESSISLVGSDQMIEGLINWIDSATLRSSLINFSMRAITSWWSLSYDRRKQTINNWYESMRLTLREHKLWSSIMRSVLLFLHFIFVYLQLLFAQSRQSTFHLRIQCTIDMRYVPATEYLRIEWKNLSLGDRSMMIDSDSREKRVCRVFASEKDWYRLGYIGRLYWIRSSEIEVNEAEKMKKKKT